MSSFIRSDIYTGNSNLEESVPAGETHEVITKFHFPNATFMQDEMGNFKLYEVYSTRINLEELIHRRYESFKVDLLPFPHKGEQYLVVRLTDGVTDIAIPEELGKQLDQFLGQLNTCYCPIISSSKSITYDGVILPVNWLAAMLNFIKLENHNFIYRDGILYANLSTFQTYNYVRERLILEILDLLRKLYVLGTIVLNSSRQSDLIKRWELHELTLVDYLEFGQEIPETRLFEQVGKFRIYRHGGLAATFAPDPTIFLLELSAGTRRFKFRIGPDISARYSVAKYFAKHNVIGHMYDDYVIVEVTKLNDLLRINHYVDKALATRTLKEGIYEIKILPRGSLVAGAATTHKYMDETHENIAEYFDIISGVERVDKTLTIPTI